MRRLVALACVLLAWPAAARAQQPQKPPIGHFAFDIRGFYSGLGQDPITAAAIGLAPTDLPGRALGGVAGVQLYPIRLKNMAFGVGAEGVLARGHAQQVDATSGDPVGQPVHQAMMGLSTQISLNFGHRDGWSYISAGMGPLSLATYQGVDAPADPAPRQMTINWGAGARWFNTAHLAFCFDIRFYLTRPEDPTDAYPGRQRTRLMVMSAGVAIK